MAAPSPCSCSRPPRRRRPRRTSTSTLSIQLRRPAADRRPSPPALRRPLNDRVRVIQSRTIQPLSLNSRVAGLATLVLALFWLALATPAGAQDITFPPLTGRVVD